MSKPKEFFEINLKSLQHFGLLLVEYYNLNHK